MLNNSLSAEGSLLEDKKVLTFQVIKVIAGILLIFFIPLEYLISETLCSMEKSGMVRIQDNRKDSAVDFFKGIHHMGDPYYMIIVFPVLYHFYDARKAMKIIMIVCVALYLHSILALIYVEPRPFWYSSGIKAEICEEGFGNPVREIMLSTVLSIVTCTEIFKTRSPIEQIIAYSISVSFITLYVTASLYLGEHFPHQCIITLFFAFIYVTSVFALDKYVTEWALRCNYGYNENRKNSIYCFIATMVLFLAIIATNNLITNKKGISIYWIKHALSHCSNHYEVNGSASFYTSAWIFYMQGAVFGCMFTAKQLSMFWWMTPYWKRALRAIVAAAISFGIFQLFWLFDFKYDTSTYVFNYVTPLFILSFIVHGILPLAFSRVHLALKISPEADDETELTNFYGGL